VPTPSPTEGRRLEPTGFPVIPGMSLGVVTGDLGRRTLGPGGPPAEEYARDDQPADDPERANRSGWNCRTHFEYEGIAAVDFYIPLDTPIFSTMDGTATLYAVSTLNDFDRYSVFREPYLGNPDRSRAPLSPFPGPSSGLGVYVEVVNDGFVTRYGHLDLEATVLGIDASAFAGEYTPDSDYGRLFSGVDVPPEPAVIASWPVRAEQFIGRSGDSGYSEGPHLHYTVRRTDGAAPLCPTTEEGFEDGGWLFR